MQKTRCDWCVGDALYEDYHDNEWGVPLHDDQKLFEFLVLESFQAGLSWLTILRKREAFRKAFHNFDIATVAGYGEKEIEELMQNAGIIRNRPKVKAAITNARQVLEIQKEHGSFATFLWDFVDGTPLQKTRVSTAEVPAKTERSEKLCKALKKKGFKFVGPTVAYAFMQAVGMINDHIESCFRNAALSDGN